MKKALIIVDIQNDFCEGGSLAVPKGNEVIPLINDLLDRVKFDSVILTQDFHPPEHTSFARNHPGSKEFTEIKLEDDQIQMLWPAHCVQGTKGTEFHHDLKIKSEYIVVKKGMNPKYDSYSGFWDNNKKNQTELEAKLKELKVDTVFVCGLALDYCVAFTALDAVNAGFKTFLIIDGTRGINEKSIKEMCKKMEDEAVETIYAADISFRRGKINVKKPQPIANDEEIEAEDKDEVDFGDEYTEKTRRKNIRTPRKTPSKGNISPTFKEEDYANLDKFYYEKDVSFKGQPPTEREKKLILQLGYLQKENEELKSKKRKADYIAQSDTPYGEENGEDSERKGKRKK